MKKCFVAIIILLFAFFDGKTQSNLSGWSKKFEAYQSAWPGVKLHLILNQEKFSPGDTAWFKAYFLKEDLTPIHGKQVIDLNLVDFQGASKLHFIFNVNNGLGENQLVIPQSLPAGIYLVTAHSSWMKNFDPQLIFKKEIIIVRKNVLVGDNKLFLSAVPEGRHLIRDVSNKISIRSGRALSSVQLIDSTGLEISRTTTDFIGAASIVFIPKRNGSYFVRMIGESVQVPLPETEDDGCSIFVTPSVKDAPVKVLVATPEGSALRDKELVMMVTSRDKIVHTNSFVQGFKDVVTLQIPQENLPEGIVHISLLDPAGQLLASRDFYSQDKEQVIAKVDVPKDHFQTREKVRLEVSLTNNKGEPIEGEFSIKILNAAISDIRKESSLADELNILSGTKERFHIDRSDPNWMMSLDNYLISVTEVVPWKEILVSETKQPRYAFTNVVQKTGRAYFADTNEPVPDLTQIMFYLQKDKWRYQTFTLDNGKVRLALPDIFGDDELFYVGETKNEKEIRDLKIVWDEEPVQLPQAPVSKETETADGYATFVSKTRLIDRSYGFYISPEGKTPVRKERNFEEEINGADITVNIQSYIIFPTMEELVREIIPSLYHRKVGRKSMVRVNLPEPMQATGDPLYIIDGIATKSTAFFLSLKPSDILTVKIVNDFHKLARLSLLGKNGVVIVQTKNGNTREPLDDRSKIIEGLSRSAKFKARDYSDEKDLHKPDFRSTIHWTPSVKTDTNGKAHVEFFCSDDIGQLNIRIDGIGAGGNPFSAEREIKVGVDPMKN